MAQRIITLILLLCSASASAGLFDAPGRSNFVPADRAFAFDFQQNQHDLNLSWHIKDGYYLYRKQITLTTKDAAIVDPSLPPGEWHEDEFYGKSEIYRQRLMLPITLTQAGKAATLTVTYQGCADAGFCYPPETKVVPLSAGARRFRQGASGPTFFSHAPRQRQPDRRGTRVAAIFGAMGAADWYRHRLYALCFTDVSADFRDCPRR